MNEMTSPVHARGTPRAHPFKRLVLKPFSSVWLGISLAIVLFLYCSIGSAVPLVRQLPALEMTEFEWFHWWPFNLLMVLLCLNLIVVTVRRIPLRWVNAGVWTIHSGIIILCLGSYYYFGTKVEGDTPLFRRRIEISLPGMDKPAYLPALPGNQTTVDVGPDRWQFQIESTNTSWPILSEEHKGETAYAVNVMVSPPTGNPFIRQLLSGFPQYTEDVIPGQGRAIKIESIGRKLVVEELRIALTYEPQDYFHVMDTWALYARRSGETEWTQRPIHGMPRYNDRIGSRDQVFIDPTHHVPVRSIDLEVPPSTGADAFGSASVRVTGFLRYAQMQAQWRDGGDRLNPVLSASMIPSDGATAPVELIAFDPTRSQSPDGMVQFVWLNDFSAVDTLPTDARATLSITVPGTNVALDIPITSDSVVGSDGPYTDLGQSGFAYRIHNLQDNLALQSPARSVSVAIVGIKTPEGAFTRMVADRPEMTRDMRDNGDPHMPDGGAAKQVDERIKMSYQPRSAPILFAAHPRGLHLIVNGAEGRMLGRDVRIGESVEIVPGLAVRADALWANATSEVKPYIVPPSARRVGLGEAFSMVRLEVHSGGTTLSEWLPFNQYAFPSHQYVYGGRFTYSPVPFHLADGTHIEVMFSRERRKLPHPMALEDFTLDAHVGGYTGAVHTIRNYISELRFLDGGQWTDPHSIKVNAPTEYGSLWYFQSMWDKPPQGASGGGMNYTGLGVCNRNGVYIQLAGCCLAVAGMIFAFYVKPFIRRRQQQRPSGKIRGDVQTSNGNRLSNAASGIELDSVARVDIT